MAALCLPSIALSGCERMAALGFDTQSAFGSVSLGDRCADIAHRALPDSGLDITDRRVSVDGNTTMVVIVGARTAVPANGLYTREVAAECRFEDGILMGFRWTGGPIRPATAGQAP